MKFPLRFFRVAALLMLVFCLADCSSTQSSSNAVSGSGSSATDDWFKSKQWLGGLKVTPHTSIDQDEFAKQYRSNQKRWDIGFAYLKNTKLAGLTAGKHLIDGENVYALVTEGPLKELDKTLFEAHQKYSDIHLMVKGKEKIGVAPFSSATLVTPYDPVRDIGFYNAEGQYHTGDTETIFILFPKDAHRPNLKLEGYDLVKKVVIKIRRAESN
ncbi:MAG: hypothetical protein JWQ40_2136 [Segetibacter sp.]|nr:hypothetical protein [Segetibacter sp.]